MDRTQLKHRLVGAIVLVALGVIFIPMILTTDDEFTISDTNIPAKPAELQQLGEMSMPQPVATPPKPAVEARIVDEQTPQSEPVAADTASDTVSTTPTKPVQSTAPATTHPSQSQGGATKPADTKPVAKSDTASSRAWVVQVASFTDRDKALALRDRLRKAKYPTFVESIAVKNTKLYRVRVGPVVRREHADEWQKKIARDFKLKDALVMAHPG